MLPLSPLESIDVVQGNQNIDGLILQEHVPPLENIIRVVLNHKSRDLLRRYDGNAGTDGDPTEDVHRSTSITLSVISRWN